MEDIRITYSEVALGLFVFNVVIGLLFGSLPLITGWKLKKQRLAWIGFAVTVVAGTLLGVIGAYVAALVFLLLILRRYTTPSDPAQPESEDAGSPKA